MTFCQSYSQHYKSIRHVSMTIRTLFAVTLLALVICSCYDREREERLTTRERNLLVREKEFAMKEAEYRALLRMRDSLMTLKDTLHTITMWPEYISGEWSAKVTCTESNCADYVVGDQRKDIWLFSQDSTQIVTKVINNNQLVRVYKASYTPDLINLNFRTDSAASKQVVMNVILNDISDQKMRGTRIITVDNRCTAKFNVELNRISK